MSDNRHWRVEVSVNGEPILALETECLAGAPDIDAYTDDIRNCAEHLLAFIGDPHPSSSAELSRLSALVAEWQKAAEPFVAVAQNDIGECEADADFFRPIGIKYARVKLLTVGNFRRLSQLKDTTNADK